MVDDASNSCVEQLKFYFEKNKHLSNYDIVAAGDFDLSELEGISLALFMGEWCENACNHAAQQMLDEIGSGDLGLIAKIHEYGVKIIYVDIPDNMEGFDRFGINAVPASVRYNDGEFRKSSSGSGGYVTNLIRLISNT